MQGFGDIKAALMEIAQEQQKEEAENVQKEEILPEAPRDCAIDAQSHIAEIRLLTKKAEIAKKSSTRKIKKEDHSKGYYDKLSAKDKLKKKSMQKNKRNKK